MNELFYCQECEDANRNPIVNLDRRLRCEVCGSDAVESVERIIHLQRPAKRTTPRLVLIARTL